MFNVMKNDLIKKIKGAIFATESILELLKCFFRVRRRYICIMKYIYIYIYIYIYTHTHTHTHTHTYIYIDLGKI